MRVGRYRSRPIYGRVVHKAPVLRIQDLAERNRAFEEVARMYGSVQRQTGVVPRRRVTAFRLPGGGHLPSLGFPPQSGSFQHLKELIRTERARELQEQRMAEEVAARAAALKELAGTGNHRTQANYRDVNYNYDIDAIRDEQAENYMIGGRGGGGGGGVLAFPDLLAPAAAAAAAAAVRHQMLQQQEPPPPSDPRFIQDYSNSYSIPTGRRDRDRPRNHHNSHSSAALFDTSSFNVDDLEGLML